MRKNLKVGSTVLVKVDPRQNSGSDVAAGTVTKVDEETVNVRVFLDSDESLWLRDVSVTSSKPGVEDESLRRVCWPAS